MADPDTLLELQELDLTRDRATRRLAELDAGPGVAAAQTALDSAEGSLAELEESAGTAIARRDAAEKTMSEAELRHAKAKKTLSTATDPRIMDGLAHEVSVTAEREEAALIAYSEADAECDEAESARDAAADRVEKAHAELDRAREGDAAERAATLAALADAKAAVVELRDSLADELLTAYDTMRSARGGAVVGRLESGTCGVCHMHLSAVDRDHLRHDFAGRIVSCPDCESMLVRPEPTRAESTTGVAADEER